MACLATLAMPESEPDPDLAFTPSAYDRDA